MVSSKIIEKTASQGKVLKFFLLDTLKATFGMVNLAWGWTQSGHFFLKSGHFFWFSKKGRGGLHPSHPLLAHLPRNINHSAFPPRSTKLCNMHRGGGKFKLFSTRSGFSDQILTGELSRIDFAGARRQDVKNLFLIWQNYLRSSIVNFIAFAINFKMAEKYHIEY